VKLDDGRALRLNRYAETLANTTLYQAANAGAVERAMDNGTELVFVDVHPAVIDFCLELQGKVFALTQEAADEWGVPLLSSCPNGGAPFHPNCRHTISGYNPAKSRKGKLPVASDNFLGVDNGDAQKEFLERLSENPLKFKKEIAAHAALAGFGDREIALKQRDAALKGERIPGIVGKAEYFPETGKALSEDVHLYKRNQEAEAAGRAPVTRTGYRGQLAEALTGATDTFDAGGGRLYYFNEKTNYMAIAQAATGMVVSGYPVTAAEWDDFKEQKS
jgi:hypothetical protein